MSVHCALNCERRRDTPKQHRKDGPTRHRALITHCWCSSSTYYSSTPNAGRAMQMSRALAEAKNFKIVKHRLAQQSAGRGRNEFYGCPESVQSILSQDSIQLGNS
eukprot:COSAG03_NODE_2509_length_2687_cov_2.403014_4_plen_105_part_00